MRAAEAPPSLQLAPGAQDAQGEQQLHQTRCEAAQVQDILALQGTCQRMTHDFSSSQRTATNQASTLGICDVILKSLSCSKSASGYCSRLCPCARSHRRASSCEACGCARCQSASLPVASFMGGPLAAGPSSSAICTMPCLIQC